MSSLDIPTADPEDIRAEADRILELPEFRDNRNIIERAIDWIGEQISRLIPDGAGGGGLSGILTLIIVLVTVAMLALGMRALTRLYRERKQREDESELTVVLGEAVDPAELDAAIDAAESTGDWKSALLGRYRHMIATLVGRGVLSELPGRTTGEYRQEMSDSEPEHTADFGAATAAFEEAFYGDGHVGPDDVSALRGRISAVVGTQVTRS